MTDTSPRMVTLEEIVALAQDLVEANPDARNATQGRPCQYRDAAGHPLCVIGHVLAKMGEDLNKLDPVMNTGRINSPAVHHQLEHRFTVEALDFMARLQYNADIRDVTTNNWPDGYSTITWADAWRNLMTNPFPGWVGDQVVTDGA